MQKINVFFIFLFPDVPRQRALISNDPENFLTRAPMEALSTFACLFRE